MVCVRFAVLMFIEIRKYILKSNYSLGELQMSMAQRLMMEEKTPFRQHFILKSVLPIKEL